MLILLLVAGGYFVGSVPFAFLLARHAGGVDIRRAGSGNVGAANVARTTGAAIAVGVVALDAAKGAAAVVLAQRLAGGSFAPAVAGFAAVLGHVYPVWLGFRGGKGVATSCGVFAMLAPIATIIAGMVFVMAVWHSRYVSVGSVLASIALGPLTYVTHAPPATVLAAVATAAVIVQRHRSNLARLQAGTERRLGQRA